MPLSEIRSLAKQIEPSEIGAVLRGGLGNQLFIYSASLSQAYRLGSSLVLFVPDDLAHGGLQIGPLLDESVRIVNYKRSRSTFFSRLRKNRTQPTSIAYG